MTVGERIKARRKELCLSADSLAERIGVSRSTMFRYESGDIEKLPADSLAPIASALNTSVEYLMGWSNEENTTESKFYSQLNDMSADLWVKQQVAITDEFMQADTSGMTKEEQSVFLQQLIDKYAPYRIAPTDSSSESIASSLDQLSDNQLDDLFMQLISGKDKDYLLRLASKILEIASKN